MHFDLLLESSLRLVFPGEVREIQFTFSTFTGRLEMSHQWQKSPAPCFGRVLPVSGHNADMNADTAWTSWLGFRKKTEASRGLPAGGRRVRLYLELWHGRMPQPWRGDKNSATFLQLAFPAPSGSHSTCTFLDGSSERSNFACPQWGGLAPTSGFWISQKEPDT